MDYLKADGTMPRLNIILKDMPPADTREILLKISKAAVSHGRMSWRLPARKVRVNCPVAGSAEMARSNLYEGAILIAGEGYEAGKAKLEKIDTSFLIQATGRFLKRRWS